MPFDTSDKQRLQTTAGWQRVVIALLCLAVSLALGGVVLTLPPQANGLAPLVQADLQNSGVANPVTAVLLNFRGYDTLLEIGVLLLAVFGVWSLRRAEFAANGLQQSFGGPVLLALVRLLVPVMIVISGYLVWIGAKEPGGAFQGGAVLGAAWVLLMLSGWQLPARYRGWPLRAALTFGFAVFLLVATGALITGRLLEYPRAWAGMLILMIESALLLSISVILASLFAGSPDEGAAVESKQATEVEP